MNRIYASSELLANTHTSTIVSEMRIKNEWTTHTQPCAAIARQLTWSQYNFRDSNDRIDRFERKNNCVDFMWSPLSVCFIERYSFFLFSVQAMKGTGANGRDNNALMLPWCSVIRHTHTHILNCIVLQCNRVDRFNVNHRQKIRITPRDQRGKQNIITPHACWTKDKTFNRKNNCIISFALCVCDCVYTIMIDIGKNIIIVTNKTFFPPCLCFLYIVRTELRMYIKMVIAYTLHIRRVTIAHQWRKNNINTCDWCSANCV